jgi:hypothetical protein
MGSRGPLALAVLLILGLGLAINSPRGLFSQEGQYDTESRETMRWANWGGIALGLALTGWAVWRFFDRFGGFDVFYF